MSWLICLYQSRINMHIICLFLEYVKYYNLKMFKYHRQIQISSKINTFFILNYDKPIYSTAMIRILTTKFGA